MHAWISCLFVFNNIFIIPCKAGVDMQRFFFIAVPADTFTYSQCSHITLPQKLKVRLITEGSRLCDPETQSYLTTCADCS